MSAFQKEAASGGVTTYVCIDCSYSTNMNKEYWNKAIEIAEMNGNAEFLLWDISVDKLSREQVLMWAKSCRGRSGTSPQCFLPLIKNGSRLIILTDGQVSGSAVTECDRLMKDKSLSYVEVYFVNTGGNMNLSVSAPFTRSCEYCIFVDDVKLADGSSNSAINLTPYRDNPTSFVKDAESLLKLVVMQNVGKQNLPLRNEILDLQKNLLATVAANNSSAVDETTSNLRNLLVAGQYDAAVLETRRISSAGDSSVGQRIETVCQELVRAVSGSNDFSFSMLQPGRLARAELVQTTRVEELPVVEQCSDRWVCPIQLSTDFPLLLLADGAPVFEDLDKGYLDMLLTNPLMVLANTDLVQKIRARLDHPVGLDAAKELFSRGNVKSIYTRRPVSCALALGDHKSHTVATNFALARMFFGDKLVGLPELWLAVVYFVVESTTYLVETEGFTDIFRACMLRRMKRQQTNMTLTGLPVEPMIKVPIDIAVWYCVVSPHVVGNWTGDDDARNRLRSFGLAAPYLVRLVELLGYPYDRAWTLNQLSLYKAFSWMMREENDNSQWRKLLRAQHQNSMRLDDQYATIVLLDGEATVDKPALPSDFRCCPEAEAVSLPELLALSKLVNRQKSVNTVSLPRNLPVDANSVPAAVYNYAYHLHSEADYSQFQPELCRFTLRPVVMDRRRRLHWTACAVEIFGPLDRQISLYNWFIKYVMENGAYPTRSGFIAFLSSKQANREDGKAKDTLPANILYQVDIVFQNYENVLGVGFADVTPLEFKTTAYASMREVDRVELDGSNRIV